MESVYSSVRQLTEIIQLIKINFPTLNDSERSDILRDCVNVRINISQE